MNLTTSKGKFSLQLCDGQSGELAVSVLTVVRKGASGSSRWAALLGGRASCHPTKFPFHSTLLLLLKVK